MFFTTACGDSRRELTKMEEFYRIIEGDDEFEILCISRAEGEKEVKDYWEKNGFTIPVAAVADRSIYNKFAQSGVPRLYITQDCEIKEIYSEELPSSLVEY